MLLRSFTLAATLAFAPFAVQASTVAFSATGSADVFQVDPTLTEFLFLDEDGDDTEIAIEGIFENGVADGAIQISDFANGVLFASDEIFSFDLGTDVLTVVFNASNFETNLFDQIATVVFTFDLASASDGFYDLVSVDVFSDIAPVPLPASLPLLLAGLGVIAAVRRRRT